MINKVPSSELNVFYKICEKLEDFVKYVLKAIPTKQQLEVIKSVDEGHKFIAVKSGHGVGKSVLLSWISIWICITKTDAKVPITAPSAPQLTLTLFPEIKKWLLKLPKIFSDSYVVKMDEIKFENNNFIALRTSRKETPEALQGFHAENLVYLVDEASGVPPEVFEVIDGALTGEKNRLIMVGNPTRTSGYFYDAFHRNKDIWKTFTLNAELSENVTKERIERARAQYGITSDAYKVRILGEFPSSSSDALFSVEELEDAINREVSKDLGNEIWGLDVAEFGDDYSVLCKRRGSYIRGFTKFSNLDAVALGEQIANEYKNASIKPKAIYVDVVGIGAGVWSVLLRFNLPVFRADVRGKTNENGLFNKRMEIYKKLKDNLPLLSIPDDDELIGELGALKYEITDNGLTKLESKRNTKKSLGRSPDKADSLAITFFYDFDFVDESDVSYEYESYRSASILGGIAW